MMKPIFMGRVFRWPNALKLSDSPAEDKTKHEQRARAVRWSAWLGPRLQSGRTWTDVEPGGGMMGAAAGKG